MNEQKKTPVLASKQRYEAPKANCVRVKLGERLGCCLFTTPHYCGYAGN